MTFICPSLDPSDIEGGDILDIFVTNEVSNMDTFMFMSRVFVLFNCLSMKILKRSLWKLPTSDAAFA